MIVVARYSHKDGENFLKQHYSNELNEIYEIINLVDATKFKTKISKEKTMRGKMLYSPKPLNTEFIKQFNNRGWQKQRIKMTTYISEINLKHEGFREIDLVKNKVGVEIQFGKYAFMVYNILAKMTIFNKQNIIDCGVEIVPMRSMAEEMSTGVSYFEQIKSDLEYRGTSNIDIPILVLGIDVFKRQYNAILTS
jgi:hypothetical protein